MLMNRIESSLVNSPPRRWLQRHYEMPWLRRNGPPLSRDARVLEIGCGQGYGTQLILEAFKPASVDAVDLDRRMVDRARRRLHDHSDEVTIAQGSVVDLIAALDARDRSYDAVFDFAIIHHIPDWRAALDEVSRVLRPGGAFYFDEVTAVALSSRTYRLLFDHPHHDRFTAAQFLDACAKRGLRVTRHRIHRRGRYLIGAATKMPAPRHRTHTVGTVDDTESHA